MFKNSSDNEHVFIISCALGEYSSQVLGSHSPVITFAILIAYSLSDSEHTFISCALGEHAQVLIINSHSLIICVGKDRLVMFNRAIC